MRTTSTVISTSHPHGRDGGVQPSTQTGCQWHGRGDVANKEVFDAEVDVIYQALRVFEARNESSIQHTFSDSTAARTVIEVADRLITRGNSVTHKGVEGNEVAGDFAKEATQNVMDSPRPFDQKNGRGKDSGHESLDRKLCLK